MSEQRRFKGMGPVGVKTREQFEERFWAKVDVCGPDECWEWLAARSPKGYGHQTWPIAWVREGSVPSGGQAHRIALAMCGADPFDQRLALHSCDNPPCCNPAHLRYGTARENAEERDARGRLVVGFKHRGSAHPHAKLTEDQVREIRTRRTAGEKLAPLAREYGMCEASISAIATRRLWKHIP